MSLDRISVNTWGFDVQLRHLKYFLEVLETQNLGKAASKLNISQPALTKAIHRLEEELGIPLFTRTRRGMVGNEYAESLRGFARASVLGLRNSTSELEAIRAGKAGRVVIAAPPLLGMIHLPPALIKFHKSYPNIRVVVKPAIAELFDLLAEGQCDLVLAMRPTIHKRFEGLEENIFSNDRMVVISRPGHPITHIGNPNIKHLARYSWILPLSGTILRGRLDNIFDEAGVSPPHCAIESLTPELAKQVVCNTDLLGWIPASSCRTEISEGIVVATRLTSPLTTLKVGLFWNSYHLTPATLRLRNTILDEWL